MLYGDMLVYINKLKVYEYPGASCDSRLIYVLETYFSEKDRSDVLSELDIPILKKVFSDRWDEIIDTPMDYLVSQTGINDLWIRFASLIYTAYSNTELIQDYFGLLIPSLTKFYSPISRSRVSEEPLSHYLLMEDKSALISLVESERYSLANGGLFLNCSIDEPRPFSEPEIRRIERKGVWTKKYIQQIIDTANYKPIHTLKFSTVQALKNLVREGFYPDGLKYKHVLSDFESTQTDDAYHSFLLFLKHLEQDDKSEFFHLMEHPIRLYNVKNSFRNLWDGVIYRDECASSASEYFLKLILDYYPQARSFRPVILHHIDASDLRTDEDPLEYADLGAKETMLRLSVIFISLMTESFCCAPLTSQLISWRGYSNKVTHSGKQIFDLILPLLQEMVFARAVYSYEKILEKIYMAIREPKWVRYPTTEVWMERVLSDEILKIHDLNASLPELFANIVNELIAAKGASHRLIVLFDFTDELLTGFFLDSNIYISFVMLQIIRIRLLKKKENIELKDKLSTSNTMKDVTLSTFNMLDSIKHYFYLRLTALLSSSPSSLSSKKPDFFKPSQIILQQIETIQATSVQGLCENILHIADDRAIISSDQKLMIVAYFDAMRNGSIYSPRKKGVASQEKGYTRLLSSMF